MKKPKDFSIQTKLLAIILGTTMAVLGTFFAYNIINDIGKLREQLVSDANLTARLVGDYSITDLAFDDSKTSKITLRKLENFPEVVYVCLYYEEGEVFSIYDKTGGEIIPPPVSPPRSDFVDDYLNVFQIIQQDDYTYGTIYLKVSTAKLAKQINRYLLTSAAALLILIVISTFAAYKLQGIISKPILKLARTTQEISEYGDYSTRVQKPRDDEIGELYDGFNSMLEQIQKREQERDTAQAALIQSEAILKKAQEISEIGSYEWNVSENSLIWSDEMFRIYGVDKNSFQPTIEKAVELTRPDDRKRIQEAIEETIVNKKVQRTEYRILCPDGTEKVVLVDGEATLDDHGNLTKIIGFVQDITERTEAEKALQKTSKQMRALATHLQSVREEERTAIAREMHDELGQDLTAFKMDLTFLEKQIQSGKKNDSDHLRSINDLKIFIDETVHKVRSLIRYLRPEVLDDLGLIEALQWQAQEFKSRTGIDIKFKSNIKKIKVDKNTSTALFRIFQEALTNITRHARATQVDVNIEKKEQIFSLKVTDNGVGISSDIGDKSKSFGLLGMKERALILGGKVEVNGADGKGTTVKARIPIK